jgi:TonB-linked SusC/RagA family outer membrane protein
MRPRIQARLVCLLAVLAVLITSNAFAQKKPKGRDLTGTVVDPSGAPIAGATVTVDGVATPITATSGDDGTFKLAAVPIVNLGLTITADGYDPQRIEVIGGKTALQLQVVLVKPPPPPAPETRVVSGVVVDGDRNPVGGATVTVQGANPISAVTDEDGTFTIPGVSTSDVALTVSSSGNPDATIEVPAAKGAVVVMVGQPGGPDTGHPVVPTTRTLDGRVTEAETGDPVIGATVIVTGTSFSAITDENGAFSIEGLPLAELPVEISAYGHETRVVNLGREQIGMDVVLALSEGEQIVIEGRAPVIVKQNLANGASVVNDKQLNRVSSQTLDDALQGKLAGANLQFNSGAPGGGAQLRLRGISTINGQSSPLYVIDGVIVSNVATQSGSNTITGAAAGGAATANQDNPVNRIADLNTNDIETIEVLKGASAAALYGSKAANGVVIITTKRGHGGKTSVSVIQRFGTSMVSNTIGSRTFESLEEVQAAYCPPSDPQCTTGLAGAYMASDGGVFDHEGEITQTTFATETIASAAGGTDKGNYYGSVLVKDEPGVLVGTYYEKQSGRLSLGYDLWDRVKVGISANVIHSRSDRGLSNNDNTGTSNYVVLSGTPSFVDLRPNNGVYPANPAVGSGTNPMQTVQLFNNTEDVWRMIAGSNAQLDVWKSSDKTHQVKLLANVGVDSFDQKNNILSPPELIFEPRVDGLAGTSIDATTTNLNFNLGTGALWQLTPKSGTFKSAFSAGLTYESVDLSSLYVTAQDLPAGQPNVDSGSSHNVAQTRLRTKDSGIYAQEEVALLDDKLSILGGLLGERSSLNGNPDKYYVYPKLAAVYELGLAPEKLDVFRVRGAYGQAGNRPNYGQRFTALTANGTIDGNSGLQLGLNAGDEDIEPERQQEFEMGVDVATTGQRAVVEATFYRRDISNLLLQRTLPTSSGFTTQFFNGGAMSNTGIELAAQVTPVSGDLDWTTRATLTLNRSRIKSLPDGIPYFDITAAGFGAGLGAYRIEPGKSATQLVATVGDTERVVGDGEPDFRVGWSNEVTWKSWTLGTLLDWQQGSEIVNLTRLLYDFGQVTPDYVDQDPEDAPVSSPPNSGEERLARFLGGDMRPYIERATFAKIREITVSYDFPEKIAKQIGPLNALQVSLQGRNLLTFTNYSGLDPEVSNFGNQPIGRNYDVAPYPPSRSFWVSLTAGL